MRARSRHGAGSRAACGSPRADRADAGAARVRSTRRRARPTTSWSRPSNGQPVWGSCVAAQAARGRVDARAALAQCIDFELLAQRRRARGLASDPEVATRDAHRAGRTALVAHDYEDGYTQPARLRRDLGHASCKKRGSAIDHEEYRASSYVRVPVDAGAPPDADAAAHAVADSIARAVANETGLSRRLLARARAARPPRAAKLEHQDVPRVSQPARSTSRYGDALFALPEVGRASAAVRTQWGWDVILWTDDVPAARSPRRRRSPPSSCPDVKRRVLRRTGSTGSRSRCSSTSRRLGAHPTNADAARELRRSAR